MLLSSLSNILKPLSSSTYFAKWWTSLHSCLWKTEPSRKPLSFPVMILSPVTSEPVHLRNVSAFSVFGCDRPNLFEMWTKINEAVEAKQLSDFLRIGGCKLKGLWVPLICLKEGDIKKQQQHQKNSKYDSNTFPHRTGKAWRKAK